MVDFVTEKEFSRRLLLLVGTVLAICIAAIFIMLFLSYNIKNNAVTVQNYRKELKSRMNASLSILSLKSDFERAKPYFKVFENILPIRDQLIAFPKEISFFAQKNKVDVAVSFGAETPATGSAPGSVRFGIRAQGSYENILKFMQEVGRGKYIIDWGDIDFSADSKGYQGIIAGKVFYD